MISIDAQDSQCSARAGVLSLAHSDVAVPAFMPVGTNGTVKAMLHSALSDIGYSLILGNTYHLYLRPGTKIIKAYGGLHKFSAWDKNILTDSGGFQVFSLSNFRKIDNGGVSFRSHIDGSKHRLTPESAVDIQTILGSDIQMQLDVCTAPGISKEEAKRASDLTTAWAKRAKQRWLEKNDDYNGALFAVVQGNFFQELRKRSCEELAELDLPGYAIGGLSVGEEKSIFQDFLHYTAPMLPIYKPKYIMGIGTPRYMLEAIEAGMDLFDCVYPTRVARNGTCFTGRGMINLKNAQFRDDARPIEENCPCPACQRYSRAYIRHLFVTKEILGPMLTTHHNLQFVFSMVENARKAIYEGRFLKFKQAFLEHFESMGRE